MRISVIIPALDEEPSVARAVESASGAFEVIVSDGGSSDGTREAALASGARVVSSQRGRGAQMDFGAEAAAGEALLFLHADARLPADWKGCVEAAIRGGAVAGAFTLSVEAAGLRYRLLEAAVSARSALLGLVFGDQALFATREAFTRAGGFRKLPLMEDVDCVRRLKGQGAFALLGAEVSVSARRWERRGIARNGLSNLALLALWRAGFSPERLYRIYYG